MTKLSVAMLGPLGKLDIIECRDLDVVRAILDGKTVAELSKTISCKESSTRKDMSRIYRKLGVRDRASALLKLQAIVSRKGSK